MEAKNEVNATKSDPKLYSFLLFFKVCEKSHTNKKKKT